MTSLLLGQCFQNALGLSLDRQDAFHGRMGIGAVACRPLQCGDQICPGIAPQQCQYSFGLVFAATLGPQQALEESAARLSQFREPLFEMGLTEPSVLTGAVLLEHASLSRGCVRQERMPGDLLDLGTVDDHHVLRDPHGEHVPNVPPGYGVSVLTVGDQALDVDRTVDHRPDVIGLRR